MPYADSAYRYWMIFFFKKIALFDKRQMSGNDVEISEEERWFKGVDVNAVEISEKHW